MFSSAQMQAAEQSAFTRGVNVETLMDQAGAGVARAIRQFFPKPATCIVFAGKGHNGGDALVAADQLQRIGWKIDIVQAQAFLRFRFRFRHQNQKEEVCPRSDGGLIWNRPC